MGGVTGLQTVKKGKVHHNELWQISLTVRVGGHKYSLIEH